MENGVLTHAKTTGATRVGHGGGQVGPAQALAFKRVVTTFFAGLLEPHRVVCFGAVDELGAQDASGPQGLAFGFRGFVNNCEDGAFAKCAVKINLARKNLDQLMGNRVGHTGFIGGGVQGGSHSAA